MGYTHYWTFKPIKRGETAKVNKAYKLAVRKCQELLIYWNEMHAHEPDLRLAGYAAHAKPGLYGGLTLTVHEKTRTKTFWFVNTISKTLNVTTSGFAKQIENHMIPW